MENRIDDYTGVSHDEGLRAYFIGIFNRMLLGLLITAGVAYSLPGLLPGVEDSMNGGAYRIFWWVAIAFEFILIFVIASKATSMNGAAATMWFYVFAALNGFTLLPITYVYTQESIALAFVSAASVFAGAALYGYTTKKDITGWGNILFMGLIGLIVAMLINLFLASGMFGYLLSIAGVVLFTALTAWDMQKLKKLYFDNPERAEQMAACGALDLYLDFINLFLFLLRLIGVKVKD
jgi:FtsH-binding integral membrane protein